MRTRSSSSTLASSGHILSCLIFVGLAGVKQHLVLRPVCLVATRGVPAFSIVLLRASALLFGVPWLIVHFYLSHVLQVPFLQLQPAASALCEHLPHRARRDASPCDGGRRPLG